MNSSDTKTWTINISKKDVFFDIDLLSLYYSEVSAGDAPVKADRIATETAKESQTRIFTRLCDHRMSDIRQLLEKFIRAVETPTSTGSDTLDTSTNWQIRIRITEEAEDNTLATIADFIHDYLVSGALADYYAQIGQQGNRESLNLRAQNDYERIRELIYYRPMP